MNQLQLTSALSAHIVLFIILCIACAWQSYKCIALYELKETSVKMILMDAMDERFPAISINPGFRPEMLGKNISGVSTLEHFLFQPNLAQLKRPICLAKAGIITTPLLMLFTGRS